MNKYIIPANTKRSRLFLGYFNLEDGIIVGIGSLLTIIFLITIKSPGLGMTIFILVPALTSAFLVFPIKNYHNVKQLIVNIYTFYTGRRKYYWKGWCVRDYVKDK